MHNGSIRRTARWLVAVMAVTVLTGCGESPLESVGDRSSEWIGPVADGVQFLTDDSSEDSPEVGAVRVSSDEG